MSEIRVRPTTFTVTGLPVEDVNSQVWSLKIEWRGVSDDGKRDTWAVTHLSRCLNTEGGWDYEPSPSNRDEEFLATHRWSLHEATALAIEALPKLVVNGLHIQDGRLVQA